MTGTVLRQTAPRAHECPTPWRFWWRRLGVGAQWQCDCGLIWEVMKNWKFQAQAGNQVYRTEWTCIEPLSPGPLLED